MKLIALITLIVWPVIPLFWIPVHLFPRFFRKLKLFTYAIPVIAWLPVAYLIYQNGDFLLYYKLNFPGVIRGTGIFFLIAGTGTHLWTAKLLNFWGLIGLPEVYEEMKGRLVATGAFSVVRHPTYLAHTIMFTGIFLASGVISVGIVTCVDFLVINLFVIPLEEKELIARFGEEYRDYIKKVPKLIPRLRF